MRIAIGCDHRGVEIKEAVIKILKEGGHFYEDFGGWVTDDPIDYPEVARRLAQGVAGKVFDRGILICDTGIGMCMAANKVKWIRAAVCHDVFNATRARQHNDANILCLAAHDGEAPMREIVNTFLNTPFEGGRHQRRVNKMLEMEGIRIVEEDDEEKRRRASF